jgi:transglutaminase-like putative cysteine protease
MSQLKNKVIPLVIIFFNMVIMGMVMESAYFIDGFRHFDIMAFALLPVLIVLAFLGILKGENLYFRIGFLVLGAVSAFLLYRAVKTIDFFQIPSDIAVINNSIMDGMSIQFRDFLNVLKVMMLTGAVILSVTLYIFPYNMVILDMGLLLFLWIVDYYGNTYEYARFFVPVWTFSLLFYRTTLVDQEVRVLKVNRNRRLVEALALTLVITLGSAFIDVEAKGVYSDRLFNYFNGQVVPQGNIKGSSIKDPFGIAMTGYNDSETLLGGDISISNEEVMRAFGEEPIYLRGTVRTEYLGNRWARDIIEYEPNGNLSSEKTAYYERLTVNENLKRLEIRPVIEITSNLFSGIYTKEVAFSNNLALLFYNEERGTYTSNKTVINNYDITYFKEDLIEDHIKRLPKTVHEPDFFMKYGTYLQINDTVTERTVDLVNSLVNDSMRNYEKAEILSNYLRDHYSYTLTPGELPDNTDFVDYFLFEVGEGYCVYFGTALTVMLRIAGVPSRYVEGFKMSEEVVDGEFIIRNSDAHAWTEVLIDEENDIWHIFDATGTPRELIFEEEPEEEEPVDEEGETPEETPGSEESPEEEEEETPGERPQDEKEERTKKNTVLLLLVSILLAALIRAGYKKIMLQKTMKSKSLKPYFREMLRLFAFIYYRKEPGETYLEMAARIKDEEIREKMEQLVSEVYKEEFSGEMGEFRERQAFYDDVYGIVKDYRGPIYAFVKKYFL